MENFELVIDELRKKADLSKSSKSDYNKELRKRLSHAANIFEELDQKTIDPKPFDSLLKRLKEILSRTEIKVVEIIKFNKALLKFIQKEYGLTTKNYYQTQWMVLGMIIFGLPFGLMYSLALDNFAFFGIGLPIGMPIGLALGAAKDKKAKEEGLQLSTVCES